jgi:hypothetical protein
MKPRLPDPKAAAAPEDYPGAVSAHCFELAAQLGGGPVRDALIAMGHDYSARARETAQTVGFRLELARSRQDDAGFRPLRLLAELLAPLPPRPAARPAAQPQTRPAAAPQTQYAAAPTVARDAPVKPSKRAPRLFRMHALTVIDS